MDQKSAGSLSITRSSISRHGLAIADDLVKKTKLLMVSVVSASLMFDEASDIQMSKHLNMFLNVSFEYVFKCLLETGEVKTLTLALEGTLNLLIIIS